MAKSKSGEGNEEALFTSMEDLHEKEEVTNKESTQTELFSGVASSLVSEKFSGDFYFILF